MDSKDGYYKVISDNGLVLEIITNLYYSPYDWNAGVDSLELSTLTPMVFDINYSPTIKAIHVEEDTQQWQEKANKTIEGHATSLDKLSFNNLFIKSNKFTPYIKELYLSGIYNGKDVSEQDFYITRAGLQGGQIFIVIKDNNSNNVVSIQLDNSEIKYHKSSDYYGQDKGVTLEIVETLGDSPYDWNSGVDTDDNSKLLKCSFDINYSPTIKAVHDAENINSPIKGKKGYFIGDSIMIGNDSIETTRSITYYLTNKYGMNCVNKAIGGAVLTSNENSTNGGIYKQLMEIPEDADYIIMQGGVNGIDKEETEEKPWGWGKMTDSYGSYESDFDTNLQIPCLEAMCKYVITHFPTKKYGFIITYKIDYWFGYWDEKSELIKKVLEKWGIPYLDWRQSGITLASEAIKEQYGVDAFASYPEYSSDSTYNIDDRVLKDGNAYKANTTISTPEEWNPLHWDLISETRYDGWHCNSKAYEQLADKTAAWMNSL